MTTLSAIGSVRQKLKGFITACSRFVKYPIMDESQAIATVFKPPASVRGMMEIDRKAFAKQVEIPTLLVPARSVQKFTKSFKADIFKKRNAEIVDDQHDDEKMKDSKFITMRPDFDVKKLCPEKLDKLKELNVEEKTYPKKLNISYENYKFSEILSAVLPEGMEATSGFETVGHIIHVNLRDHQKPYKKIIGQVLIDTHKQVRTVVDKSCIIDNTYRNFSMDVIAGEEDFVTRVIEYGRSFEFDFSKVFWNSRLQTEHRRIFDAIPKESVVFDVFAGVGPFSIPLARKGCKVYANDLNSESHKWLVHNAKLNKAKLETFNLDGRAFIRECLAKYLKSSPCATKTVYLVMNLPGHAIDFLDAFQGLLSTDFENAISLDTALPTVHIFCYVFSSAEDKIDDVRKRGAKSLGQSLPEDNEVREVRKVSPSKDQFCLNFDLPQSIMFKDMRSSSVANVEVAPEQKRIKLSSDDTGS